MQQISHKPCYGRTGRHDDAPGDIIRFIRVKANGGFKLILQPAQKTDAVFKLRKVFIAFSVRERMPGNLIEFVRRKHKTRTMRCKHFFLKGVGLQKNLLPKSPLRSLLKSLPKSPPVKKLLP